MSPHPEPTSPSHPSAHSSSSSSSSSSTAPLSPTFDPSSRHHFGYKFGQRDSGNSTPYPFGEGGPGATSSAGGVGGGSRNGSSRLGEGIGGGRAGAGGGGSGSGSGSGGGEGGDVRTQATSVSSSWVEKSPMIDILESGGKGTETTEMEEKMDRMDHQVIGTGNENPTSDDFEKSALGLGLHHPAASASAVEESSAHPQSEFTNEEEENPQLNGTIFQEGPESESALSEPESEAEISGLPRTRQKEPRMTTRGEQQQESNTTVDGLPSTVPSSSEWANVSANAMLASGLLQPQTSTSSSNLASPSSTNVNVMVPATAPAAIAMSGVTSGMSRMAMAARAAKGKERMDRRNSLDQGESVEGRDDGAGVAEAIDELENAHPLSDKALAERGYVSHILFKHPFHLETRWTHLRELGQGAYGLVISAQDAFSGETIAIKLLTKVFDKLILAKRCLREITLLRHLNGHENITGLIDLDVIVDDFNEIQMFMEPMEADLHQIIRSGQALTNSHIQYFLYQILRGMKYIHSANVIHRDLKPGNLLVNADCELKICDFGLARGFRPDPTEWDPNSMPEGGALTEYVATRWYRAPEIMLSYRRYSTAIDVWSIGCVLAELLGGRPIFKGKDYIDQLNLIVGVLGTPSEITYQRLGSERACAYMNSLPIKAKVEFATLYPNADPQAVDLLSRMLTFDPSDRITVKEALAHPYMATYHDETDEPDCPTVFDKWEQVENIQSMEDFRREIQREVDEFRAEVRAVDDWAEEEEEEEEEEPVTEELAGILPDMSISHAIAEERQEDADEVVQDYSVPPPRQHGHNSPRKQQSNSVFSSASTTPRSVPSELSPLSSPAPSAALNLRDTGHAGRRSRAGSGTSGGTVTDPFARRPSSMFASFGGLGSMGFTPMESGSSNLANRESGGHHPHHASRYSVSSTSDFGTNGRYKSRSSSSSSVARPLVRALSTLSVADLGTAGLSHMTDHPPPMSVSPSDAPPSEAPLSFGVKKTRRSPQPPQDES